MAVITFPLSRIEGHARVVIDLHDGRVVSAHFQATEMRGFQHLLRGVPAEQMPVIAPRICGVCSTAHHVAAVKALEDAYGVTPPPLALRIRELLMLGQLIQNQATSLFFFTMPDRLGSPGLLQCAAEDLGSSEERQAIALRALQVRKAGTDLITAAGGQFIHPVKAVVGGVSSGVEVGAAAPVREQLAAALPLACELFDEYWRLTERLRDRTGTWGDDTPTRYIAAVGERRPNFCGDVLRVTGTDGAVCATFPARELREHLAYEDTDYSYAGRTSYLGDIVRANSLARINMAREMCTERADRYLDRFRHAFGGPAHAILLFDLARGIELVYGIERALELLSMPLLGEDTAVAHTPKDGEGFGLVEAPRGPLVHRYRIEGGRIADVELIIPTVHNVGAIERALRVAAERYITADAVNLELERAVGRVVRAFDPCIACATH
ncbi:MAG: Ni/Fe hydrogenase subunit alpha [Acidobacteriota bacterium]